jgi:hypothetical protein
MSPRTFDSFALTDEQQTGNSQSQGRPDLTTRGTDAILVARYVEGPGGVLLRYQLDRRVTAMDHDAAPASKTTTPVASRYSVFSLQPLPIFIQS